MMLNMPGLELQAIPADGSKSTPIQKFVDYEVNHELMIADGAFAINLVPDSDTRLAHGDIAELYVLGQRVLSGWIEVVERKASKMERLYSVYGRSTSSILVDNAILPDGDMWDKHKGVRLLDMMRKLLGQFPASHRPKLDTSIIVSEGAGLDVEISPGDTYWEVMTRIATARGLFLVCLADGSLALRTLSKAEASNDFSIEFGTPHANALEATITYDETKRYANIIVISQDTNNKQGFAVVNDTGAIFPRTVVVNPEQDGENLEDYGKLCRAKQIKDSMQYTYTVPGHDQDGKVWAVGAGASVNDAINGIEGLFLITGVTFTLSKREGKRTVVKLARYLDI